MKARPPALIFSLSVLVLLPLWKSFPAFAESVLPQNKVPGRIESTVRRLTQDLSKRGFEVERGYFRLYTKDDCAYSYAIMGTCFLNNPAAPYVLPVMPLWPDEVIDDATVSAFGPTHEGYSITYRFDPREAILILGQLPPKAKYFGLQSYLFTRQGDFKRDSAMYYKMSLFGQGLLDTFFHYLPNNPDRIVTLDSLSDDINNAVIAQQSGSAFDELRYFIITPDQSMDGTLRNALNKISIDEKDVFTEPIPSNKIMGLDSAADEFLSLIRYAMPQDEADAQNWRDRLPLVILRIRPTHPDAAPIPYNAFTEPEPRQIFVNEFQWEADLDSLVSAVFQKWDQAYDPARIKKQIDFESFFELVGPKCEQIGMDCLADDQDAVYQAHPSGFTLDNGEVYAYLGALGEATGNATYVGLGINNAKLKLGVYNISGDELLGSANEFAGQVPNSDKFFVYYFTRDCTGLEYLTGEYCYSIPEEDIPVCTDPTGASCVKGVFTERDYLLPGTQRGPDSTFILPGRYIKLQDPRP